LEPIRSSGPPNISPIKILLAIISDPVLFLSTITSPVFQKTPTSNVIILAMMRTVAYDRVHVDQVFETLGLADPRLEMRSGYPYHHLFEHASSKAQLVASDQHSHDLAGFASREAAMLAVPRVWSHTDKRP
jgi:hypothetical protein